MNIPFQDWQVPLIKEYLKSRDVYIPRRALKDQLVVLANRVQKEDRIVYPASGLRSIGEINALYYFILISDLKMIKKILRCHPEYLGRINNHGNLPIDVAEEVGNEKVITYLKNKMKRDGIDY